MPSATAPDRRPLTTVQRHLYAAGHFGVSLVGYMMVQPVLKFYFPDTESAANLVPILLAPYILLLGRITDGINDPVMGHFSDKLRTRWGRRKPMMLAGFPLLCLFFVLLWHPPAAQTSAANFWYVSLMSVIYFVAFTAFTGPYLALLADVTHTSAERRKLAGLQGMYNVAGLIVAGLLIGVCRGMGWSYPQIAWLVTAIALAAFILPLFGPRDDPARVAKLETPPLIRSVSMTLRNRPFRIYVISKLLFLTGLFLIVQALPYMVETLLDQPTDAEAGTLTGIALLCGVVCIPMLLRLADRRGKKWAYQFSMLWFAGSACCIASLAALGGVEHGVWIARAVMALSGLGVAGLFSIPYAILSDVTDHDRLQTGMERQGIYFCVQGLILKAGYAAAPLIVGQLLVLFPSSKPTVLALMGPIGGVFGLIAYVVFRRFPEEEVQRAVEIVEEGRREGT